MKNKKIIHLPMTFTKEYFTIGACGKFQDEKKILCKTEAALLYAKLHQFLFPENEN